MLTIQQYNITPKSLTFSLLPITNFTSNTFREQATKMMEHPLYHTVASLSDDFSSPPGSAIYFIAAINFPCPMLMVSANNDSNHNNQLALFYRHSSRQFDHWRG